MNFSAVILAGGRSARMGRDKAWLELDGETLLARQMALARGAGAAEILISGRPGVNYSEFGCRVVADLVPGGGPLAGIQAALAGMQGPLLLVLAVDMVHLTVDVLNALLAHCDRDSGAVPEHDGVVEALAAVYPRASLELARRLFTSSPAGTAPGAKHFARACVEAGLARVVTVPPPAVGLFKNWNCPADLLDRPVRGASPIDRAPGREKVRGDR